jgi:hypothetical protein
MTARDLRAAARSNHVDVPATMPILEKKDKAPLTEEEARYWAAGDEYGESPMAISPFAAGSQRATEDLWVVVRGLQDRVDRLERENAELKISLGAELKISQEKVLAVMKEQQKPLHRMVEMAVQKVEGAVAGAAKREEEIKKLGVQVTEQQLLLQKVVNMGNPVEKGGGLGGTRGAPDTKRSYSQVAGTNLLTMVMKDRQLDGYEDRDLTDAVQRRLKDTMGVYATVKFTRRMYIKGAQAGKDRAVGNVAFTVDSMHDVHEINNARHKLSRYPDIHIDDFLGPEVLEQRSKLWPRFLSANREKKRSAVWRRARLFINGKEVTEVKK